MKKIVKRIIGLLMALPGLGLLWLTIFNRAYDVTISQIIISVVSMFVSILVTLFFLYGMWLLIMAPED